MHRNMEMALQAPATMDAGFSDAMKDEIRSQLFELNKMTEMTGQIFSNSMRLQEEYTYCYNLCSQIPGNLSDYSNNQLPAEQKKDLQRKLDLIKTLGNLRQRLARMRSEFTKKHKSTLSDLEAVLPKVIHDARKTFERRQQLHRNGASFDARMVDALQEWYVALENIIVKMRGQVINQNELRNSLPFPGETDNDFPAMLATANNLLVSLVERAFVIENQPNQVMKKDCKFKVRVRLLCCGMLNLQGNPPVVKAYILSEKQAADMKHGKDIHTEECGKILNGEAPLSFQSGKLAIDYANMCLKGFERPVAQRKLAEPVTEGKFCLHFTSKVSIRLNALEQETAIQVMSLPIVIIVHGNQECDASSTAIWDNQFADIDRTPFFVRDSVPWSEMATLLSLLFYGWTGKGLDSTSLLYLKTILFENEPINFEVSWKKFKKDNILGRKFTFWEWFWSIGKLVREEQVKEIWKRGLIVGFIDQNEAYSRLMTLPSGTFLLRFSNSTLGGISAAFVKDNPDVAGGKVFKCLRPFTVKDFETIKLADCVRHIEDLQTLYPNQDKAEAFGEFYTSAGGCPVEGYLDVDLRLHIREKSEDVGSSMSDASVRSPLASNIYGQSCVSPQGSSPSSSATQELSQSQFAQGNACPPETPGFVSDCLSLLIKPQTLDEILAKLHEDFTTTNSDTEFLIHDFDAYD